MRIICVDDEAPALARFELLASQIAGITDVKTFCDPAAAIEYANNSPVDAAFLDVEMPGMSGIELAQVLSAADPDIRIVFVTAYDSYALAAFEANAIDYILKPFGREKLAHAVEKAARMRGSAPRRISVRTFGGFDVFLDGHLINISSQKPYELLALLVDRRGGAVSPGTAIACLWEDRPNDSGTSALYRMTGKRLRQLLLTAGIGELLVGDGYRAVDTAVFDCDYYQLLDGDPEAAARFCGDYMPDFDWAEETNAKLIELKEKILGQQRRLV